MGQNSRDATDVAHVDVGETLDDHESRISRLEVWRHRTEGALAILGFLLGGGAFVTLLLFVLGVV